MGDEINYYGMPEKWFPLPKTLRRVLEKIDPLELTPRGQASPSLYTLKERRWISFEGYAPDAGRAGMQMYLRTVSGQKALEIDDQVQKQIGDAEGF
jgi:hypothetical protein